MVHFLVRTMDPCDSRMPPFSPLQDYGTSNGLDLTVNAQHPRLHAPPAASPWPRLADDEDEEDDEEVRYGATRPKMFEMGPLDDPAMEERRQRAIYAKRNREMKKREVEKLQREAAALRDIMEQCQAKVAGMNHLAQSQQSKIQELERSLADARQQLRARDQQLLSTQERQRRMRTHLEMIAEGCEENNMARRMILTMLATTSLSEER
ncbi:uncharacterized protein LOC126999324 [Eriocheir sinensis]|uniref:uncharacterized protein LOC126999324 n=1 Tax=Eriocheir sinensis TaxID=95602 RepID=UPI0021C5DC67|nr:uncharacterized protein LOC126999324 [Eriocheir sinensis]